MVSNLPERFRPGTNSWWWALTTAIALHSAIGADAISRERTHHLRRITAPTFQSQDVHTLRRVLDCGDPCVYVGLEAYFGAVGASEAVLSETTTASLAAAAANSAHSDIATATRAVAPGNLVSVRKLPRKMQCPTTWLRLLSSCPATDWPPPRDVPDTLRDAYTIGGRVAVSDWYFSQRYSGGDAMSPRWSTVDLDARIAAPSLENAMQGIQSYGMEEARYVDHAIARHAKDSIKGRVGVVWGSELPWVEVLLARHGAKQVVTVEYGRIDVEEHAVISATTPNQLAAMMLVHPRSFDFAVTFSSLEHSGLGRYGDALNPYGDIEAAVQTWCLLRPGGIFLLGLPATDPSASQDHLVWNAHRYYGPLRLAEMFAGYEHLETIDSSAFGGSVHDASLIHVLRKPATTEDN